MTALTCRGYCDADLPRLQAALAQWRRTAGGCGYCHVGDLPHRVYDELHGRGPVGSLVSVWEGDGHRVAGVAVTMRHGESFDVFTEPTLRGTGAEEAMLRAAYETTRRHMAMAGRGPDPVVTDVYGCDETRAELLERLGFARYRMWDHVTERDLTAPVPPVDVPDGFVVRTARLADCAGLAEVRGTQAGPHPVRSVTVTDLGSSHGEAVRTHHPPPIVATASPCEPCPHAAARSVVSPRMPPERPSPAAARRPYRLLP